jgi:transposase
VKQGRTDIRGWNLGRALFVADSGMNSKENRKELACDYGYKGLLLI